MRNLYPIFIYRYASKEVKSKLSLIHRLPTISFSLFPIQGIKNSRKNIKFGVVPKKKLLYETWMGGSSDFHFNKKKLPSHRKQQFCMDQSMNKIMRKLDTWSQNYLKNLNNFSNIEKERNFFPKAKIGLPTHYLIIKKMTTESH